MTAKLIETGEIIEVNRCRSATYSRIIEDELDFGENYSGPLTCGKILNIIRKSYKQGKDDMFNKAYEWLKEHLAEETSVICDGNVRINFNNVIEKFKKAMEE